MVSLAVVLPNLSGGQMATSYLCSRIIPCVNFWGSFMVLLDLTDNFFERFTPKCSELVWVVPSRSMEAKHLTLFFCDALRQV